MADLPSGTVTFLLTDVEGSTALWEDAPGAMRSSLVRHDASFEATAALVRDDRPGTRGAGHGRPRAAGKEGFTAAWVAGRALTVDRAVAEALQATAEPSGESGTLT